MPEGPEIEMAEIKEKIEALQEEEQEERAESSWTRQVALVTALIAVFAAVGSMQSGAMVNEAMISQIKASDKWSEYQSAKLKAHAYSIKVDEFEDLGDPKFESRKEAYKEKTKSYLERAESELMPEAKKLEEEGAHLMHKHHGYAIAVTLAQVAIGISALSVLTKQRALWAVGFLMGIAGVAYMILQVIQP